MPAICPICSNQCKNDVKLQKHVWAVHREHLSDNGSLKPAVASALAKGVALPETPEVKKEVPVSPDAPAPVPSSAELDAKLPFPCPTCDRRFGSKKGLGLICRNLGLERTYKLDLNMLSAFGFEDLDVR